MNDLEKRVLELSYRNKLSHISSCLNSVNVIADIYERRKDDEPFCLDNSHAGLGLFVVLEARGYNDAQKLIERHGVHAGRDKEAGIYVSGGSLGQVATISVGMALADRSRKVWLVTSDGALAEGACWEAFNLAWMQGLTNLDINVVANGLGAYRTIDLGRLKDQLSSFLYPLTFSMHYRNMPYPWLEGLKGHYMQMSDENFEEAMKE